MKAHGMWAGAHAGSSRCHWIGGCVVGSAKVGRNDPCPCGSGKKYKHCCERKAHALSPTAWIAIVGVGVVALIALLLSFTVTTPAINDVRCPPGQTWSVEHGHCH